MQVYSCIDDQNGGQWFKDNTVPNEGKIGHSDVTIRLFTGFLFVGYHSCMYASFTFSDMLFVTNLYNRDPFNRKLLSTK